MAFRTELSLGQVAEREDCHHFESDESLQLNSLQKEWFKYTLESNVYSYDWLNGYTNLPFRSIQKAIALFLTVGK